ncbi:MAG: phenazine biosynthesis protein PhzF [Confluentimicrobium sp.]|uniref:PhzF family phenazine biosynthesis protein n=1 Tax=Actibacterium sp. TaxID=1872125 RepID=UPI000C4C2D06|nr:PhzF family phenazine biosynthesis protein [Actibacterium sp.]MBC56387.1 phenazine biosynthesis protein PhzF [Actibacterium sp.]|tara:strand:- start:429 stop:1316 length:888 start_codon:yes stop_codon:yes gene_type:complete
MPAAVAFDWVDAFTDQPFGGNGCAVFHDAAALDPETCTAIVRETSLTECTFLERSDVADVRVRYFLASREIPFAGHPTIATVASLIERGLVTGERLTLETLAGVIPIEIEYGRGAPRIAMMQNAPEFGAPVRAALVADAVGLKPADIIFPPQVVSTGLPFCVTVVSGHEALRRATLNPRGLKHFQDIVGGADADVMEPFLVTLEGATPAGQTFSRLLLAPPAPAEDPFTGSATGCMAAYLWHNDLIDTPRFTAEQGHWMNRPGQAEVSVLGPREAITGVRVGGQGRVLMRGEILL